jgi:hypothetical protein
VTIVLPSLAWRRCSRSAASRCSGARRGVVVAPRAE